MFRNAHGTSQVKKKERRKKKELKKHEKERDRWSISNLEKRERKLEGFKVGLVVEARGSSFTSHHHWVLLSEADRVRCGQGEGSGHSAGPFCFSNFLSPSVLAEDIAPCMDTW